MGECIDRAALMGELTSSATQLAMRDMTGAEAYTEFLRLVNSAPAADMVDAGELREFAEDVARQFGYHCIHGGQPAYYHGGLSTLEWAWSILDWPDLKPAPECKCEEEGCHDWGTCGVNTPDGYKWLCSKHYMMYEARAEAEREADND